MFQALLQQVNVARELCSLLLGERRGLKRRPFCRQHECELEAECLLAQVDDGINGRRREAASLRPYAIANG